MSTLTVSNIKKTGETASRDAAGVAAAWVAFNMATATVNDSINNSSIYDNGTGDFNLNFTSHMANNGYTHTGGVTTTLTTSVIFSLEGPDAVALDSVYQESLFRVTCSYVNSAVNRTNYDVARANVVIHGDLA